MVAANRGGDAGRAGGRTARKRGGAYAGLPNGKNNARTRVPRCGVGVPAATPQSAQRTDSRSAVTALLRTIKRGAAGSVTKQRDIGPRQTVLLTTVTGRGDHTRCVGFTGTNGRAASPVTGRRDA